MLMSALVLAATVAAAPQPPTVETAREAQVRSVWSPPPGKPVEVFVDTYPDQTDVIFPAPIQHVEVDPGGAADRSDWDAARLSVWAHQPLRDGQSLGVRVTLEDETRLALRLVMRTQLRDIHLSIREPPPSESEREAQERLSRCRPLAEVISDKARLIAERGSEAVIHRQVGEGHTAKQTHQLSLSFVDVVHDAGISYVTLRIRNRSELHWPVALDDIHLMEAEGGEVRIISRASKLEEIPPGEESRIVLAYETPQSTRLVAILEKGGLLSLLVAVIP